jgi:hypothetical protein
MDLEQLAHFERIQTCADAIATLPWIEAGEPETIMQVLLDFDSEYWTLVKYLSLPLYAELLSLLQQGVVQGGLTERPRLAVVVPVFEASEALLLPALQSLHGQVGVAIECLISVDGCSADLELVERLLGKLGDPGPHFTARVLFSDENRGVALCRNRAMKEISAPFFSWLDDDDLFHPLRCLHGLLVMALQGVSRINTGWSRVSLSQKKIVMINDRLSSFGHNSFIARTELLERYGYLADLKVHEDTEFMQRHDFLQIPSFNSPFVGHYLHTEPTSEHCSLASGWRKEVHSIDGHPYLCGTVLASMPEQLVQREKTYLELYGSIVFASFSKQFPAC